jgi:hypothetical protein
MLAQDSFVYEPMIMYLGISITSKPIVALAREK